MRVLTIRIFNILLSKNNSYLVSALDDDNISDKCILKKVDLDKYKTYVYDLLKEEANIKNVWNNFISKFMFQKMQILILLMIMILLDLLKLFLNLKLRMNLWMNSL